MAQEIATRNGPTGREPRVLDASVLAFDIPRELERLRAEPAWTVERRNAVTLLKGSRLRVVLQVMQAGSRLQVPHADGPITLLPLSGRIALRAGELRQEAGPWCLLALQRRVAHEVEALEESVVVLTIAFEGHDASGSESS